MIDLARALAFKQFNDEEYFEFEGNYYEDNLDDVVKEYESDKDNWESLAEYIDQNCIQIDEWDNDKEDDKVYTDEEADEVCKERISESLWAFNADFIARHSQHVGYSRDLEKSISLVQDKLSESANDLVAALITDMDHFVQDAMKADRRGHFLAGYDGEENQVSVTVDGVEYDFFIYKG